MWDDLGERRGRMKDVRRSIGHGGKWYGEMSTNGVRSGRMTFIEREVGGCGTMGWVGERTGREFE